MNRSFYARHAWWIMLLLAALAPLLAWGTFQAFDNSNNNVSQWLPQDFPDTEVYQGFREVFGADDFAVVSWEGCTLDDPRLETFAERLVPAPEEQKPGGDWVYFTKVITGPRAMASLMGEPFELTEKQAIDRLVEVLIGPDRKTTCAVVTLSPLGDEDRTDALAAMQRTAIEQCGIDPKDLRLGGDAVINAAIDIESQRAITRWIGLSWLIALALAWFCLKRFKLMAMVFIVSGYSAMLGTAMVHFTGGQMNLVMVMVPVLIYVLNLSASVHLSNYYRDAIREEGIAGAPMRAISHGFVPCALSATTTALGLGSLYVSHIVPVKQFGFYSALGVMLGLGVLFALLPALLETWPLNSNAAEARREVAHSAERRDRLLRSIAEWIVRHHRAVAGVCTLVLLLCSWGSLSVETAIQPRKFFSDSSRWVHDLQWFSDHLGPLVPVEVLLEFDVDNKMTMLDRMEMVGRVQRVISAMDDVGGTVSATTYAPPLGADTWMRRRVLDKQLEENREVFVDSHYLGRRGDRELWRITARVHGSRDARYDHFLEEIQHRVDRYLAAKYPDHKEVRAIYTGAVPLVFVAQQELLDGLMKSFFLAFVLIALVMIVLLRSLWAGLVVMLPNIFPAAVTFGSMGWSSLEVDVGAMMTASVALGIAVDDTLHFLTWFRRGMLRGETRLEAIVDAYQRCAVAMAQTTLIAGLAIVVFVLSDFQPVSRFGLLMFILLFAALAGDLIYLPALLASRLGRCFQYASKTSVEETPTAEKEPVESEV